MGERRGGVVLAFLNEVAGGRKLLEAHRERDDSVRGDVSASLVVGAEGGAGPELGRHLEPKAAERPERYTCVSPPTGQMTREEVCDRLGTTLAELYRWDIASKVQPMSRGP